MFEKQGDAWHVSVGNLKEQREFIPQGQKQSNLDNAYLDEDGNIRMCRHTKQSLIAFFRGRLEFT